MSRFLDLFLGASVQPKPGTYLPAVASHLRCSRRTVQAQGPTWLLLFFLTHGAWFASRAAVDYPLRVGPTQHYLVDQAGQPFLLHADTPWSLIVGLTTNEVGIYLEARREQGINAIIVNLIEHEYAGGDNFYGPPHNRNGDAPFTRPNDFETPNETYFAHADWVIRQADERGMVVLLAPCYMGFPGTQSGWYSEVVSNGIDKCRAYGEWVGNRYKDFRNLIWVMYGDRNADDATPMVEAMVAGLRSRDTNHLITAHFQRNVSARDFLNDSSWLTLDSVYTTDIAYPNCLQEYNRTPPMPFFLIEARYENEHGISTAGLRRQAYTALLSGAMGQAFGNRPVWLFDTGWSNALASAGSLSMVNVRKLFLSRNWTALVPDELHQAIPFGFSSGETYVAAARASDGSSIIAYMPVGGTITVDLRKVGGTQAKAWWYNVRDGTATAVGLFSTSGRSVFTAPTTDDWVLVIDNLERGYGAPGNVPVTAGLDVDAGLDQVAAWPGISKVTLTGRVFKDGRLVSPGTVPVRWEMVQGPTAVYFSPSSLVLSPQVNFFAPGNYEFRLTAEDSGESDFDRTHVTLEPSRPPNAPANLRVNGQTNPYGLRDLSPAFSWTFTDDDPGDFQSSFRVEVFASGATSIWDSGRVISDRNSVEYAGPSLTPGAAYQWRVTVWDRFNLPAISSELAWMTLANISPELLTNPGFEAGDSRGWFQDVGGAMGVGFKPPFGRGGPRSGKYQAFWVQSSFAHFAAQRVDLSNYAAAIDSGAAWVDALGWLVADDYQQSPPWDQFYMQVRYYDRSGTERLSARYDTGTLNVPYWAQYGVRSALIPVGVRAVEVRFNTWETGYDAGAADDFTVRVYTLPSQPAVFVSAPPQTWDDIAGGGFRLSFSANLAGTYAVEASTNLVSWSRVTEINYSAGTVWISDPDVTEVGRFYRARRVGL